MSDKPKQFLMMVDEVGMALLSQLCGAVKFLQVEGLLLSDNESYQALVNPIQPAVEQPDV
jgi:hypothetical protein